ncbi:hypothetical protein SFR_7032 (plasmid) [Streptomyces sp. FR-008]|nr:hypothetical protein SFR_7032 [Streptomyces sp. FR-008]
MAGGRSGGRHLPSGQRADRPSSRPRFGAAASSSSRTPSSHTPTRTASWSRGLASTSSPPRTHPTGQRPSTSSRLTRTLLAPSLLPASTTGPPLARLGGVHG